MKIKVGVVILNYKNYSDTINCINSIMEKDSRYIDIGIVVVDNGSNNGSVDVLREKYSGMDSISIIPLKSNEGYAKGNNVGISYLRTRGFDNIFIANSDLVFPDVCVFKQMISQINSEVALIVPTIKNPDGSNDQRVIYKKKFFGLRMAKELIKSIFNDIFGKSSQDNKDYCCESHLEGDKNKYDDCYVVSGSGFLLTKYYFEYYKGLFSDIFLYGEECGTIILLHKAKLNSKVVNTDTIIHKGGASTPDSIKRNTKMRRKINLESEKKLLKLLILKSEMCERKY